jgi:hypothetical protein
MTRAILLLEGRPASSILVGQGTREARVWEELQKKAPKTLKSLDAELKSPPLAAPAGQGAGRLGDRADIFAGAREPPVASRFRLAEAALERARMRGRPFLADGA